MLKTAGYVATGDVKRFDQKYVMYNRVRWDPAVIEMGNKMYGVIPPKDKDGYSLLDRALQNSLWYVEMAYAHGHIVQNKDLFGWDKLPADCLRIPKGLKYDVKNSQEMAHYVKKAAYSLGAEMVGICNIDPRWIYSHWFNLHTRENGPLEIPSECKYAIALAFEMDYEMFRTSPTEVASAATGLGYSDMAFVAGSLAHFIRNLGYTAIPCGNDTALSIPIAIDGGLGELGRHGMIITPVFGPRIRLAKVFTDLPLTADKPIEFGVLHFCEKCKKCAEHCPGQAISHGARTDKALNVSNNSGILKWPVDAEKCFGFWAKNGTCCGNCIRVCPFNKAKGFLHSSVRWFVRNTPWLDGFLKNIDTVMGYDKSLKAFQWWNSDNKK